jgi:hypothetical protein
MKKKSVKSVKNKKNFFCKFCNYTASQKSHYNKHLKTNKHKKKVGENVEKDTKKVLKSVNNTVYSCDICSKQYKDRSGLRYHKKNADCYKNIDKSNSNQNKIDNLTKQMTKLTTSITEAVDSGMLGTKNVITNNNISINFFLDKYCNNAQSLQDFVENISFQLNDILNDNQIIDNFISKKVLKNLQDIPITERPIHCTDQKRRNFMVKDKNDGWVKDSVDTNGSLYTQVNQLHSKAYIDFYTEYDKVHPLPHDTDHETFKCEMASKLLNYDKKNIVNDIAKTSDIKHIVGTSGIKIENTDTPMLDNEMMSPTNQIKNNVDISIENVNMNNIVNKQTITKNSDSTTINTNIINMKNNMLDMVNMMNCMVKSDSDTK